MIVVFVGFLGYKKGMENSDYFKKSISDDENIFKMIKDDFDFCYVHKPMTITLKDDEKEYLKQILKNKI